jgi:hypothetical protein
MTILRVDPESISNWFDRVLAGIGHRGSSFTDVDFLGVRALTHDGLSRRFLFQEFKRPGEVCSNGQWWALYDLARQPNTTVWLVTQCEGLQAVDLLAFKEVPRDGLLDARKGLSLDDYRREFADWWNRAPVAPTPDAAALPRLLWCEYIQHDPSLQAFVQGELARERIAVQTARDEATHWRDVAERLYARQGRQKRA